MLKEAFKKVEKQTIPKRRSLGVNLTEEMYEEFLSAAAEANCSVSEYIRRLHKFAQIE